MRARILPLTIAGVLALTTGVALAETAPDDPEVVLTPVDETTTTTAVDPETTTTTTVVPPETTTTTVVVDEPEAEDQVPEEEAPEAPDLEAPEAHPENHGLYVSQAAHDHEGEGNHGASVSGVARTDVGKHHGGDEPEDEPEEG